MTEIIENSLQLVLLMTCTILAGVYAFRTRNMDAGILTMFYGSYMLGDIYWLLYLVFYNHTPDIFYVPYLSWYAAYLFLILLLKRITPEAERKESCPVAWLMPVFTGGMCVYYMQFGDYLGNLISAALMGMMMFHAVRGLIYMRKHAEARCRRALYMVLMWFCTLEYLAWTASCIFVGETLANPYFWFDFLITPCAMLLLPAFRKAVETE